MNSMGDQEAISRENGITKTSSTPASASSTQRRSTSVRVERGVLGPQDGHRVRVEGDRDDLSPSRVGQLPGPTDDVAVAEVDAVEVADDHDRATEVAGHVVQGTPDPHAENTSVGGSRPYESPCAGSTNTATARAHSPSWA